MIHTIWTLIFYQPLYNGLIFLVSIVPFADVGFAVILLTLIVKTILFPLTQKSIVSQIQLKNLEGEIAKIKIDYPDKQEQAKRTFALYKEKKVSPFSGCLPLLVQLPILIALYLVFRTGLTAAGVPALYSFVHMPVTLHTHFLGLIEMSGKSIVLALLAGISQFIQVKLMTPPGAPRPADAKPDFKADLSRNMQTQMKYVLPVMIAFVAYQVSAAAALYLVVNNIFAIVQERVVRQRFKKAQPTVTVIA